MTGAYVRVAPTKGTINYIRNLLTGIDLPLYGNRELHVTLIYSPRSAPGHEFVAEKSEHLLEEGPFTAKPLRFEVWTDHKDRKIVVLRMRSTDLTLRHEFWKQQGLLHSFPEYNPHMTITESITNLDHQRGLQGIVEMLNVMLDKNQELVFYREIMDMPKPEYKRPTGNGRRPNEVVAKGVNTSKRRGKKSKTAFPGVHQLKNVSEVGAPPVHYPNLAEDEEGSMKDHGFNIHSYKRLLDGLTSL